MYLSVSPSACVGVCECVHAADIAGFANRSTAGCGPRGGLHGAGPRGLKPPYCPYPDTLLPIQPAPCSSARPAHRHHNQYQHPSSTLSHSHAPSFLSPSCRVPFLPLSLSLSTLTQSGQISPLFLLSCLHPSTTLSFSSSTATSPSLFTFTSTSWKDLSPPLSQTSSGQRLYFHSWPFLGPSTFYYRRRRLVCVWCVTSPVLCPWGRLCGFWLARRAEKSFFLTQWKFSCCSCRPLLAFCAPSQVQVSELSAITILLLAHYVLSLCLHVPSPHFSLSALIPADWTITLCRLDS